MIKRIAKTAFYFSVLVGVLVLLGFAVGNNQSSLCRNFIVKINHDSGLRFVDSAEVVKQVYDKIGGFDGLPLNSIPMKRIEELVNAIYFVEKSKVYRTIDGQVVVEIEQREPVARVINAMNQSFYIDRNGKLMRTTTRYSARVPVVSGFIYTRYSPSFDILDFRTFPADQLSQSEAVMVGLFGLINYLSEDDFLSAWIDQIYVTRTGEFELVPRNGAHTIEIGNAEDLDRKFAKLLEFYKNGLTNIGWGKYNRINLKFKNQVVCSK